MIAASDAPWGKKADGGGLGARSGLRIGWAWNSRVLSLAPDPLPVLDSLLAATAKVYGLPLVTRNLKDVERTGVDCLNPFSVWHLDRGGS